MSVWKMRNHYTRGLAWLFGMLLIGSVQAQTPPETRDPRALLETATHEMIVALNTERDAIRANPERIYPLVENILMPHIDFITASKWVLGKYWRRASKQQKIEFIRQFRSLLLRFYSSALAEYLSSNTVRPDMFEFLPLRADPDARQVTVTSNVHSESGKIIPVKYSMHLTGKGWKVYDVAVEGVSMVTTYRTSFANEIRQKGLDGLIRSLAERNARLLKGTALTSN